MKKKVSNDRGNKNCWVAATLVGRLERGKKQNFNLGPRTKEKYSCHYDFIDMFGL
jgi:hypothetical protein